MRNALLHRGVDAITKASNMAGNVTYVQWCLTHMKAELTMSKWSIVQKTLVDNAYQMTNHCNLMLSYLILLCESSEQKVSQL